MPRLPSSTWAALACAFVLRASLVWAAPAVLGTDSPEPATPRGAAPGLGQGPPAHVRLSYSMGLVSIACWMIPGVAQLVQNYKCKSGDGIALGFVLLWLAGDLLNGTLPALLPLPLTARRHPPARVLLQ